MRFRLQLATPEGAYPLPLDGVLWLGAEGEVLEEGAPGPGVEVQGVREGVVVRPLGEGARVRLNDVQLTGAAPFRPGDELALAGCRVMLLRASASPREVGVRPAVELEPWLEAQLEGAEREGRGLSVVGLTGGAYGEEEDARLAAALPEGATAFALGLRARVVVCAGRTLNGGKGARTAHFPEDGAHAAALLARALGAEEAAGEVVVREPVMVRLRELFEHLSRGGAPLLVEGEVGVGRALWAARVLALQGKGAPLQLAGGAEGAAERLAEYGEGPLLVEEVDLLPPAAQQWLAARRGGWVATVQPGAELVPPLEAAIAHRRVYVPALRDRPQEVGALVEAELSRLRERLGRPGLHLDAQARALLLAEAWPGNVDGLKAALWRAAYAALGEGIRPDDLPVRLREAGWGLDVAGAKASAEKSALVSVLSATRWNVSEAARRLGLPRRTLVHRMGVLGLKRPARGT